MATKNGSAAFRFAGWCGNLGYDRIWCFEPDPKSFETCRGILDRLQGCEVYPYGLSDASRTVSFASSGKENARILKDGMAAGGADIQTIQTVALDDILKDERVTFIKMDIEGAEYDALAGASHLIKEQKPRLAISIYHNFNHIISIPKLLLTLRPDYRLRSPNRLCLYGYKSGRSNGQYCKWNETYP